MPSVVKELLITDDCLEVKTHYAPILHVVVCQNVRGNISLYSPDVSVRQSDPEQRGLFCKSKLVLTAWFGVVLTAHRNPVCVDLCPSVGKSS